MSFLDTEFERLYRYVQRGATGTGRHVMACAIVQRAVGGSDYSAYLKRTQRYAEEEDILSAWESVEHTISRAWQARQNAYAPYSNFRVGAAVLDENGNIAVGANVENSSYGLTLCAERAALAAAQVSSLGTILFVCIVADTPEPISPCGGCRQWIIELAPFAIVGMLTPAGPERWCTAEELLPFAFGGDVFRC